MKTIEWVDGAVALIDQTKLPLEFEIQRTTDFREVVTAIKELRVRGAPAIGVAAAYAVALGAMASDQIAVPATSGTHRASRQPGAATSAPAVTATNAATVALPIASIAAGDSSPVTPGRLRGPAARGQPKGARGRGAARARCPPSAPPPARGRARGGRRASSRGTARSSSPSPGRPPPASPRR